ncbi:MAG: phosphatidate cytidylyltransferase [Elusimicrobia bacterium]|nr:phosphatidate cytidylyltransferase [Elusimicrobiota bacterium]
MLVPRILSAIVGIPLIIACVYYGRLAFFALMLVVSFFCVKEYFSICAKYKPNAYFCVPVSALFFTALYFGLPSFGGNIIAIFAVFIALVLFFIEVIKGSPENAVARVAVSFLGTVFIPVALMYMVQIRNLPNGFEFICFLFIVTWISDTGAYAAGRAFGRHKLSPHISPKKTIEGAVAGAVTAVIVAYVFHATFTGNILPLNQTVILALVVSVIGQFSDLAESLIKRDAGIKDSGNIIPGHGGMFDRFDSYLFAAPAMFYTLYFFL